MAGVKTELELIAVSKAVQAEIKFGTDAGAALSRTTLPRQRPRVLGRCWVYLEHEMRRRGWWVGSRHPSCRVCPREVLASAAFGEARND